MKKLVWTALATLVSVTAAAISMRVLEAAWRRVVKENPPARPWWAKALVGSPLKRGVQHRAHTTVA
jgi:hypothetical protein